MCTEHLPPGGYPIAVKYVYHIISYHAQFSACICVSRNVTSRELGSLAQNVSRYSLTVCFMAQKIWLCFPFKQSLTLRPLSCNFRSNGSRELLFLWQIDGVPIRYGLLPIRLRKKLETFLPNAAEDPQRASRAQHIYFQQSRELFVLTWICLTGGGVLTVRSDASDRQILRQRTLMVTNDIRRPLLCARITCNITVIM
jgi:hypothetical protein